jgi:Alr-MurF fusion protein
VYSLEEINSVLGGQFLQLGSTGQVDQIVFDSRRIQRPLHSLFVAIVTEHNNGHKYLAEAYKKGVRNFLVSEKVSMESLPDATVIHVSNTLRALQQLAAFHRGHFNYPVIAITGSNGKTVVKEWLFHLLQDQFNIVRSPKSYNSQLGVALSVWQMNRYHQLGIFEAGISISGEMEHLQRIIQPTIGILTNIGEAHDGGFKTREQKLQEKLKLFAESEVLIVNAGLAKDISHKRLFTWGADANADVVIMSVYREKNSTTVDFVFNNTERELVLPFTDEASLQNALNCLAVICYLGLSKPEMIKRFGQLHSIDMRLQLNRGINDCLVVNDSYSADLTSLRIALDFLQQQSSGLKQTAILSGFIESGKTQEEQRLLLAELLNGYKLDKIILVGDELREVEQLLHSKEVVVHASTHELVQQFKSSSFYKEIILVKGARKYGFERIARLFEQKLHQTVLEINLNALAHNLKQYQRHVKPSTRIMAMVKAFSYGSGGAEIASVLQFHKTDFLAVAYADEGVELVKAGISLPIMVMNAEESSFTSIVEYNLQPVLYSFAVLKQFEVYLNQQGLSAYPVHIEVETGMNRLGFAFSELEQLGAYLAKNTAVVVQSVFSHLAASEEPAQDAFTILQAERFEKACNVLQQYLTYPFLKHISNSAGIIRHPRLQYDMVRLGIGLYGVETDLENVLDLLPVATLRSTIAQLKQVPSGESISYNRRTIMKRDSLIATVRIGYADGYSRRFGTGAGKMMVGNQLVPVVGTVCMDMTMIDVTDIPGVREGDDVIIFGAGLPVEKVAGWIDTIPYEIMTSVSQRVKRIYFHE